MLVLDQQKLIRYLDIAMRKQAYGSVTLTVVVKKGLPIINTARLVKMKRKKYKPHKS